MLGDLEGNVPRSGGEITAVVAAAIALSLLIALVPGPPGSVFELRPPAVR